jgi:protein TonB
MSNFEMTMDSAFTQSERPEHEVTTWVKMVLHLVYEKEYRSIWKKYRVYFGLVMVTLFELFLINFQYQKYSNAEMDALAVMVDFGEFQQLQQIQAVNIIEIDEIFGNEFIHDKEKEAEELKNFKIGVAVNPIMADATMPVDISPNIRPLYPAAARNAGIEGIVMLELVIDKDGSVLRARPAGRRLGYGLEESAVEAYSSKKKFQPSVDNKTSKPQIAKFFLPVQYVIE